MVVIFQMLENLSLRCNCVIGHVNHYDNVSLTFFFFPFSSCNLTNCISYFNDQTFLNIHFWFSQFLLQRLLLFFFFWLLLFFVHMNSVLCMLQLVQKHLNDIRLLVSFLVYQQFPWQLTCSLYVEWCLMVWLENLCIRIIGFDNFCFIITRAQSHQRKNL